tara:strand:+ start:1125 stop:1286 length:162 start_codon:yes stop_codon:yes gene_type:complete
VEEVATESFDVEEVLAARVKNDVLSVAISGAALHSYPGTVPGDGLAGNVQLKK